MRRNSRGNRWARATALLAALPLLLGASVLVRAMDADLARTALSGMAVTGVGGVLTGLAANRFLHRGSNQGENLLGLFLTTTLGVVTIGYLYLVNIRGPMSTIGTLPRLVHQGLSFLEFLTGIGSGILVGLGQRVEEPSA